MAEKNYRTVAVVPEMPRTIDTQQLHVYTPVGSINNYGVFKPDGRQFVIVNGVLRAYANYLIQLADPPAIVVEDGGEVGADIAFVEQDSTLQRKFQFTFKNIKGPQGDKGTDALQSNYTWSLDVEPYVGRTSQATFSAFNRTPVVGDMFVSVYKYLDTDLKTILGVYLVNNRITQVAEATSVCLFEITSLVQIPTNYIKEITGPVTSGLEDTYTIVFSDGTTHDFVVTNGATGAQGPAGATGAQGEQGPKGDDGVSITSVTQTGIDGGTRVTITMSDGQTTSFDVMNGINTNFQVVDVLPTENISTSTIYLVPSTTPGEENIYDEYIYVNGNWEHIGSTSVDLSDYVTKTYFNQNVGDATKNYVVAQMSKIQNLYIEMYESGSVPEKGQALTLTNANFARVPAQGQYFALIELVNTKDKYYSICKIASVDTTTCSATVEAVTELDNGTEIEAIKQSIAALTTTVEGKADISALDSKLDKVTEATTTKQFYAKAPDGSQVMTEIKGGNGITVDAASDNKFLEVKVGDTINLAENQTLAFKKNDADVPMFTIGYGTINLDPEGADGIDILVQNQSAGDWLLGTFGPNIHNLEYPTICSGSPGVSFAYTNPYYEITGVPTSATSGTLPNDKSWSYLSITPQELRLLFNKEFYQLADNQHTTGTLVFSHVGYEASQLIVKTITITIATRAWVLTTVKPAEEAYHVELSGTSGTLTTEQYNGLLNDVNSYILHTNGPVFKYVRNLTANGSLQYQNVVSNIARYISITSAGAWTFGSIILENDSNKTTTLNSSSTNTQYPSAKATYDSDQSVLTEAKAYADSILGAEQAWLQKIDSGEGV